MAAAGKATVEVTVSGPYISPTVKSPSIVKSEEINTKYLREAYADDAVIQAYADVIEQHDAIWEGIKRLMGAGIDLTGYQLRNWQVNTHHDVGEVCQSRVEFDLINVEVGIRGR